MTTNTSARTVAERVAQAPAINAAIESILVELRDAQQSIDGVRPPVDELVASYEQTLERLAVVRGAPPLYPYIGSGMGRGALVELADGSVKWDMINGIGVHMFGHGDMDLIETALRAAMSDTVMQGNLQANTETIEFAELLLAEAGRDSAIRHAFITNSGAMANESALKICFQKRDGKAPRVLVFADCFMGRTTTLTQISDNPGNRVGVPLNTLVDYMPFYDPEHGNRSIEYAVYHLKQYLEKYPGQHACFAMELVQGEGGFNVAPPEFFKPLMQMCRDHEVAVWVDEIQTFGRTEDMLHYQSLGLGQYVDVITIGKMSQVCACLYTEASKPKPGLLSGTFTGSTVGLRVGRRMLERLRDGGYYGGDGKIAALQAAFCRQAAALVKRHKDWFPAVPHPTGLARVAEGVYGGVGGMMRLTPFGGDKTKMVALCRAMYEQGVIAFYCGHGPYHVRFLPPVGVMEPEQFEDVFRIVEAAMEVVADG